MAKELNITDPEIIKKAVELIGAALLSELDKIPGIAGNATAHNLVIAAGREAYAGT